jgi:WD40 repeat protein/transcriptional regulator with XRE-family HTH domain
MKTLERDSVYGAAMLTLRTTLGLTRAELAKHLGISRQAVGEWEAGRSYPKAQHLKALIALAVKGQAFAKGSTAEEIRALWQVARQKVLLDECWLSILLEHPHSPYFHLVPKPVDGQVQADRGRRDTDRDESLSLQPLSVSLRVPAVPVEATMSSALVTTRPPSESRVDWGEAQVISLFYGREQEQALLSQWIVQESCRVVSILGMGGIGKSALAVSVMHQLAGGTRQVQDPDPPISTGCPFEVIIFRSLRDAPSCEVLLDDCLQVLSPQRLREVPTSLGPRISQLVDHLHQTRVLLVLDNLECLLKAGEPRGHFSPGFEGYGQLLQRVAETGHQSCLLLTSREKPADLRLLEGKYPQVHSLHLTGLDVAACKPLLEEKELIGTEAEQKSLISVYAGNPLALRIVAETIIDLFGGEIGLFLAGGTVTFGGITDLLDEQFARLSRLSQTLLYWLAIVREPVTPEELLALLVTPLPRMQILEAVDSLCRHSLIEHGKRSDSFTLQSVVLEYVTTTLIAEGSSEIRQGRLNRLIEHGLEQAHAKEYVRKTQERLLLTPLLAELQSLYRSSLRFTSVEMQLLDLLDQLRKETDAAQGYGPANLIALLRLQRGNLNGLNLSQLSIRGAYLQNIELQEASLSRAHIRDSAFTEAVSATWAVAISPDGRLWAASGMQGKVRVWDEGAQTLQQIWQAHTDMVQTLAFSSDGRTLASGSLDGTVKLWDLEAFSRAGTSHSPYGPRDALLWTGWQDCPQNLAFSADSSLLISAGSDATVRIWDPRSGTNLQTLRHPGHVFAVTWSPDGNLLASGCFDGELRLWKRQKVEPFTNTPILQFWTSRVIGSVASLAFSPDGRTLASTNWDRTITLWDVPSGRQLHILSGQTSQSSRVIWSPDGRTLASCSHNNAIWLWDVEQDCCRAALVGHTADINSMAFTPDSSRLLSGSGDSTLRAWDVESGQCVRVIAGYGVSLYDLDWSPDGTYLLSGGTDAQVTMWDLGGGTPPKLLHGHHWVVSGVGWNPNGRFLASCSWDAVMCLWDAASLVCIQKFEDPSAILLSMAWSPNGCLLASGTYLKGMQVWDVTTGHLRWIGLPYLISFYRVAWSPDSTWLASGGDDNIVYLWENANGTEQGLVGPQTEAVGTGLAPVRAPTAPTKLLRGHHGRVMSVVWSPDGKQLASGSGSGGNGELFVWDAQSGERVRTFAGHPSMVSALAWSRGRTGTRHSPRGNWLVSGGSDGKLRWWDVQSGECVNMRAAHQGTILSLKVSPDGERLASCGDDGVITIWDQTRFEHLRTLRRDRPYERLNITGIRGLNEAQKATLQALGAIEDSYTINGS